MKKVVVGSTECEVKYLKPASKGDTIFGVSGKWLIAVNFPWELAKELGDDFTIFTEKVKDVPERHYTLVKVIRAVRGYIRTREEVKHEKPEVWVFCGMHITHGKSIITEITEYVTEQWDGSEFKEVEVKELNRNSYMDKRITYKILEENEITKLIKKAEDFKLSDPTKGIVFRSTQLETTDSVDERILVELSKYYVIAYPFLTCRFNNLCYHLIHAYYSGKKIVFPVASFEWTPPPPLNYRISLRRFALTKYYKSKLPHGEPFREQAEFVKFAKKAYLAVTGVTVVEKPFDIFRKEVNIRVKDLTSYERFLEVFYLRTPKRKFKAVEAHFKLYEKLLRLMKDTPVLYIAFPNKYGKNCANYACIRIEGDKYSVQGLAQVPITSITIKGKFEEAYKVVHGLNKLLSYQFSPVKKKIQMLKEDIGELRAEIEEKFGKPVSELHPEYDIMKYLYNRAKERDCRNNLVLILYRARELDNAPENVTLLKLAGLIKSGRDRDYTPSKLKDILKSLRIAVKYEIKSRGYSTRLGVVFSGSAYSIARNIVETINKVKESRVKALLAEILTGYAEGECSTSVPASRLKVLMRELSLE